MDLETVSPVDFGRSLRGLGVNLLCRNVSATAAFLQGCFGMTLHRQSADFVLVRHGDVLLQIHSDATFGRHPLHSLLPESGPRGSGIQIYLFGIDPDLSASRAVHSGGMVIEPPADKPHGLREATILGPEGHAFSPAVVRP